MSKILQFNPNSQVSDNVVQLFGADGQPVVKTEQPTQPKPTSAMVADYPHSQVSNRYNQVKTIDVVQALQSNGWEVSKYSEARVRDVDRRGFQKHYVTMRPQGGSNQINVGDTEMRLILTNSHDGTSAFKLQAGLYRLVCSNGLVISAGDIEHISIRHTSSEIEQEAIDGANRIAALSPQINQIIAKLRETELSPFSQLSFARDAAAIVWDKNPDYVNIPELIQARRDSDKGNSLWLTYNRVQESLVRGGISVAASNRHTRGINSPIRDMEVNKALFELAMKYAA